jgi:hypothetical protein
VARWQDAKCRLAMGDLLVDVILSHINFVENYTFQIENKIQSLHLHPFKVTILLHITYRINLAFTEENGQSSKVIKELHFYVSDDNTTLFLWNTKCCFNGNGFVIKGYDLVSIGFFPMAM